MRGLIRLGRYSVIVAAVAILIVALVLSGAGEADIGRTIATVYVGAFIVWTLVGMAYAALEASEAATNGVTAVIEGRTVVVGKPSFVATVAPDTVRTRLESGEAAAYVAVDGRFAGVLVLADDVRPEAAEVIAWLVNHRVEHVMMLTGDVESTARSVAQRIGIDEVRAELLPPEKVALASSLQPRPMLMVGDGVNDAPALAASDVGIAMGAKGATAAGEAADIVILMDSLTKIVDAVIIGRHTLRVAFTAIWIGIVLSVGLMLVAMTGAIPAVAGALVQEFVDLATILYALRALGGPPSSSELVVTAGLIQGAGSGRKERGSGG